MGSEVCADELMNEEIPFLNTVSISKVPDEICDIVEVKNVVVLSQSSPAGNQRPSISPVTPDSSRENGEQNHNLLSPLTVVVSSPPCAPCSDTSLSDRVSSPDGNSLETPKETLFDAFAPGADKFMLAPQHRKYREQSRNHVVRRLDFSCASNLITEFSNESSIETFSDEETLFEFVYGTILDTIFSEQTDELEQVAKLSTEDSYLGSSTPKSAPLLSGVAETCPAAPTKSIGKCRNIDKEICRRLEF